VSARGKARKRAVDVLYEADMRGLEPTDVLDTTVGRRAEAGEPELNEYVQTIIAGVIEHQARIDELLSTYAQGWTLDRMPAVDRAVLRVGAYEVMYGDDIPDAVAIAEAVSLAQSLSTDDSATFVNGLLGRLAGLKSRLGATAPDATDSDS
jgi:transcription antitermination protein NusB